jgi:phosphoribosyl 1,2-cyclic phosphodiesterase
MAYRVTFWGTRGSIPTPGPTTIRYGGNTPCVALHADADGSDRVVILDAGTGIRGLGQHLLSQNDGRRVTVDLLVSHTHWDHIQGLPFFAPVFEAGNTVRIWGAEQAGVAIDKILRDQMGPVVFPVPLDEVAAEVTVKHIEPGAFGIEAFDVRAMTVRHPGTTLGFVLEPRGGGPNLGYVTDNELSGGEYDVGPGWRGDFLSFLGGVNVLVHDAMFTSQELKRHAGWGHSSNVEAVELAVEAGVEQLVLFHHRPEHDDGTIDAMLDESRQTAKRLGSRLEIIAAREGLALNL